MCVQVILKDLQDCEAQVVALEALVSSSDSNNSQLQRLHSGLTQLHTTVVVSEEDDTVTVIFLNETGRVDSLKLDRNRDQSCGLGGGVAVLCLSACCGAICGPAV